MKNNIIKVTLLIFSLWTSAVVAGDWTEPLMIEDVSFSIYEDPANNDVWLKATFTSQPKSRSCPNPTQNAAMYNPAGINSFVQTWLSMLLSTQAQNKPVKIFVSSCIQGHNIPVIHGVKVVGG